MYIKQYSEKHFSDLSLQHFNNVSRNIDVWIVFKNIRITDKNTLCVRSCMHPLKALVVKQISTQWDVTSMFVNKKSLVYFGSCQTVMMKLFSKYCFLLQECSIIGAWRLNKTLRSVLRKFWNLHQPTWLGVVEKISC